MAEQGFDRSGGEQDGAAWQQAVTAWWSPSTEPSCSVRRSAVTVPLRWEVADDEAFRRVVR
jgi:hypothetical protein